MITRLTLILLLFVPLTGFSKDIVSHFTPGKYKLKDGDLSLCSQGRFYYRENGKNLALGVFHGFDIENKKGTIQGDLPGETQCVYAFEDAVVNGEAQSELTFKEVKTCKDEKKHTLIKRAFIKKNIIELFVTQIGEGAREYQCYWELQ